MNQVKNVTNLACRLSRGVGSSFFFLVENDDETNCANDDLFRVWGEGEGEGEGGRSLGLLFQRTCNFGASFVKKKASAAAIISTMPLLLFLSAASSQGSVTELVFSCSCSQF